MSSNVLKLQQDMCAALAAKGVLTFDGVEIDVAEKVADLQANATPASLLMLYICVMAVAKNKGYNGFSGEVSSRFLETQKPVRPVQ